MNLNTLPRKLILASLLAFGSVRWLNIWHQYGFSRSPIDFPVVSSWWRDSFALFLPIVLAVWLGNVIAEGFMRVSVGRISASTQSMLAAAILSIITTLTVIAVEGNRNLATGIGNEFIILASLCGKLYPQGTMLLNMLKLIFPSVLALQYHTLIQDGINLFFVNLALTILMLLLTETFAARQKNTPAFISEDI